MLSVSKPLFTGISLGFLLGIGFFYMLSAWGNPTSGSLTQLRQVSGVNPDSDGQSANSNKHKNIPGFTLPVIPQKPQTDIITQKITTPKLIKTTIRHKPTPSTQLNVSALVIPKGLKLVGKPKVEVRADMTPRQAEEAFYKNVVTLDVSCDKNVRLGHRTDGGWDMCTIAPFAPAKPCLVYSFGINNDWSFDDDVSRRFGCDVKAFDPSMKVGDHRHSAKVMFYSTGIGGADERNTRGWKLRKLSTLFRELGDSKKIIDYLKIDVEYSEWAALKSMLKSGVLRRVRQFGFEIHTSELLRQQTSPALFTDYNNVLLQLEKEGFKRWYSHFNKWGKYFSPRTRQQRTCCYEMVYVNMNFITNQPT